MICIVKEGRYHGRRTDRELVAFIASSLAQRGNSKQRALAESGGPGDLAMALSRSQPFWIQSSAGRPDLVDHPLFDARVGIDSAIAQKWPMRALLINARPFHFGRDNLFAINRTFSDDFAVRPAHKALTPKFNSIAADRKSTRLNSSHLGISYAVF